VVLPDDEIMTLAFFVFDTIPAHDRQMDGHVATCSRKDLR